MFCSDRQSFLARARSTRFCISGSRSLRSVCSRSDCSIDPAPDRARFEEVGVLDVFSVPMEREVSEGSIRRGFYDEFWMEIGMFIARHLL